MANFEVGAITGILAGAIAGLIIVPPSDITTIAEYLIAGAIGGGFVGWLYSFIILFLVGFSEPRGTTNDEHRLARKIMLPGIATGVLAGGLFAGHWLYALIAMLAVALATAAEVFIRIRLIHKKSKP